jgi:hypothetical protein
MGDFQLQIRTRFIDLVSKTLTRILLSLFRKWRKVEEMEAMIYGQILNVFKIAVNCNVKAYGVRTLRRNT